MKKNIVVSFMRSQIVKTRAQVKFSLPSPVMLHAMAYCPQGMAQGLWPSRSVRLCHFVEVISRSMKQILRNQTYIFIKWLNILTIWPWSIIVCSQNKFFSFNISNVWFFFRITTLFFILAMEVCFCFRCLLKSFMVKQKSFNDAVKGFEYSFQDFI